MVIPSKYPRVTRVWPTFSYFALLRTLVTVTCLSPLLVVTWPTFTEKSSHFPCPDHHLTNIAIFCPAWFSPGCHLTNTSLFDQIMVSCPSPDQHVPKNTSFFIFRFFLDHRLTNISLLDPQLCPWPSPAQQIRKKTCLAHHLTNKFQKKTIPWPTRDQQIPKIWRAKSIRRG